jgi:hypothetical protein
MAEQLTCGACGFSNEPERVYCHNCGAKLDRSLLPVVEPEKDSESADSARRRIRRMTNPAGYSFGQFFKSLLAVAFWAALIAAVALIVRKPDGVPETKNDLPARLVQSELMEVTQSPVPRTISFTEADVNGALKQSLKRAGSGGVPGVDFERVYATLAPGILHIGVEQSLFGFQIYSGVDYQLTVAGGKFTPALVGGNLGRLPVHPELMKYSDFAFQKLWTALKREHDQMERMQSITIGKGVIVLVTKGASAR